MRQLVALKRLLFRALLRRNARIKVLLVTSLCVLTYCRFLLLECLAKEYIKHESVVCMYYRGRLGNLMFIHAFHYLFAKKHGMKMVKTGKFDLQDVFVLDEDFSFDESFNPVYCDCLPVLEDEYDCGFDAKLDLWPNKKGVLLFGYFQSWRYFRNKEHEIRRLFTFKEEIRTKVAHQLNTLLKASTWNYKTHQLVGVHIRRGDYKDQTISAFGYRTAPIDYIWRAMQKMSSFYRRVFFLVCSNDIKWTKTQLDNVPNVLFSEDSSPTVDLALLSLTNHTIITVGTFGWWGAFLTNGTTIYYKNVFVHNSKFAAQFPDESIDDFFPPSWIGME